MTVNHKAYEMIQSKQIKEINSEAMVLRHRKSGARILLFSNDDKNKVFSIAFRTPPQDNTGLPHILEHSVLCGSDKYPVKDVFAELCKGSLNTFLNAMTYPDKTVYPVASCNDKDFQNLMDVYLSSVFHPSIYRHPEIFMQEGWHYELQTADAPLSINGVVYNEMKGAFSDPDEVISRYLKQLLFPDNAYRFESGGDPDSIPELTYEQFLDFHRRYYHPANSYICLYGDMDMQEKLDWLDREYLSQYDYLKVDSGISDQKPFQHPIDRTVEYSVGEGEDTKERAYLAVSDCLDFGLDSRMNLAFRVLDYALLSAPGAPLKQALLDAGIGRDIYGGYDDGLKQNMFTVVAKDTDPDKHDEFLNIIHDTLCSLCEKGLDRKTLRAGLCCYEFKYREADFGSSPKGLVYALQSLDSWLYDENQPFLFLSYEEDFAWLKEKIEEEGFFEGLIRRWLIDNPHAVCLSLVPVAGLAAKKDEALAGKLSAKKQAMSDEEVDLLLKEQLRFKHYQETEDSDEDLLKIPMLSISDISPEAEKLVGVQKELEGCSVLHTSLFTGGINYIKILYPIDGVSPQELHWISLLTNVWGLVDTEHYRYQELGNEINIETGGMGCEVSAFQLIREPKQYRSFLEVSFKALQDKTGKAVELALEVLLRSSFEDTKRIREILEQTVSRMQDYLMQAGHAAAVSRVLAYGSPSGAFCDEAKGYGFYRFAKELEDHYEERKDEIVRELKKAAASCLTQRPLLQITADEKGYAAFEQAVSPLISETGHSDAKIPAKIGALGCLNEGFKTPGMVQYVARGGNFRERGYEYTGTLQVMKTMLNYGYLWNELRVKGGAYGCMCAFGKSGDAYFVSYRDPKLRSTDEVYHSIPDYLRQVRFDERERTKYIIGTISEIDMPKSPQIRGARALYAWISGVTDEMLAKERQEILACTQEDIRNLAPVVEAVLQADQLCVIGSEEKIQEEKEMFRRVLPLCR